MALQRSKGEKADILQRLRQNLSTMQEINFAYLHGTFVDEMPFNDIDIAVYLDAPVEDSFDYAMRLSVELSRDLHIPVDVQVLNGAPLSFQHPVLQSGVILLARDEGFLGDYIERLSLDYMDFAHHLDAYLEALTI
jgi:predicted nucleotidyltransferase